MAAIGGSVLGCSIAGRSFTVPNDTEVTIELGGFENDTPGNGDGTSREIKTAKAASVEGLKVVVDHDRDDFSFLQDTADSKGFKPFTITLVDGNTFQGSTQIKDMPGYSTKDAVAELKLGFTGKITKQ
jgi:hypothetical protein